MKTMKDFALQQLSKRQMNQVRGGDYLCVCDKNTESFVFKAVWNTQICIRCGQA